MLLRQSLLRLLPRLGDVASAAPFSTSGFGTGLSDGTEYPCIDDFEVAARQNAFPRVPESLRKLLTEDASESDLVQWRERMAGVDAARHPLAAQVRRIFKGHREAVHVRSVYALQFARTFNASLGCDAVQKQFGALIEQRIPEEYPPESPNWVLRKQRDLAELVELVAVAQDMHETIVNLPKDKIGGRDLVHRWEPLNGWEALGMRIDEMEEKHRVQLLEEGNKSALLCGDLLLAQASVGLAKLRNTFVVEKISMAITDHMAAKFFGRRDVQGRYLPAMSELNEETWTEQSKLSFANLMSAACESMAMLADMEAENQKLFREAGVHFALALKAYQELQTILRPPSQWPLIDLGAAPVIFHLREDKKMLTDIAHCKDNDLRNLNYGRLHSLAGNHSGVGVRETLRLIRHHVTKSWSAFDKLIFNTGDQHFLERTAERSMLRTFVHLKEGPREIQPKKEPEFTV